MDSSFGGATALRPCRAHAVAFRQHRWSTAVATSGRCIQFAFRPTETAIRWVEHLPDLELTLIRRAKNIHVNLHENLAQFDRLFLRTRLKDGVAADQLFGLDEGSIRHGQLASGGADPRPLRARQQPSRFEQYARSCHFLGMLADG